MLHAIADALQEKTGITLNVHVVENQFFGPEVTVAGLLTGGDIVSALKGKNLGEALLVPDCMLRDRGYMFLDGMTLKQMSEELGIKILPRYLRRRRGADTRLPGSMKEQNMAKPIVAVVGRPNVGKSTFFNHMAGYRISIIDDTPGVTRDRIYADCEWTGRHFTLVDTGGIDPYADDVLLTHMRQQTEDRHRDRRCDSFHGGRQGRSHRGGPGDRRYAPQGPEARWCWRSISSIIPGTMRRCMSFINWDWGSPCSCPPPTSVGLGDLLDAVISHFPEDMGQEEEDEEAPIRVAVVGKPNVGKSSLVNRILGEDRVIVSDIAGTTRDAIDTPFTVDGQKYILIDTAGIRRKSRISEELERYSVIRALSAIRRCDVALIMIDAQEEATEQDEKIAGLCHEEGRASVFVVNKWDLVDKDTWTVNGYQKRLLDHMSFMTYAPSVYISARTGQRTGKLLSMINEVYGMYSFRITTGVLNDVLAEAIAMTPPPSDKGKRLKIYYATQVSTRPPTFVLFVNESKLMHFSYQRYLENYLRKTLGLSGTPIRLYARNRRQNTQ